MKREELKELGLEKEVIDKIMDLHGQTIEKLKEDTTSLQLSLGEKEKAIAELNEQIKSSEGTEESLKELQAKVDAFEKAEKERVKEEKAKEADKILTENILSVIGERQFVNDITKDGIISQVKEELAKAENKGKGAKEIFETLTTDVEGIFKNPQHEKLEIPPVGTQNKEEKHEFRSFF